MSKDYSSLEPLTVQPEYCTSTADIDSVTGELYQPGGWKDGKCSKEIKTMSYMGTGVCGEIHRKAKARVEAGETISHPF